MKKLFPLLFLLLFSVNAQAANMAYMHTEEDDSNIVIHIYPVGEPENLLTVFDFSTGAFKFDFYFGRNGTSVSSVVDASHYRIIRENPTHNNAIYFWPTALGAGHTAGSIFVPSSKSGGYLYGSVNVCDNAIHHIVVERTAEGRLSITIDGTEDVAYESDTYDWGTSVGMHLLQTAIGYIGTLKIYKAGTLVSDTPFSSDFLDDSINNLYVEVEPEATIVDCPPTTYAVTYNGNGNTGGTVPVDGALYPTGYSAVTVLGNPGSLTRTDYNITGWGTVADGSGTNYTTGQTFTITSNVTLYAQWWHVPITSTTTISAGNQDATYFDMTEDAFYTNVADSLVGNDAEIIGKATEYGITELDSCLQFPLASPIPAGATITAATLEVYETDIGLGTTFNVRMRLEKSVNPAAFSDLANYNSRKTNLTTAYVDRTTALSEIGYTNIGDLKTALQEVLTLGEISSVAVFINDNGSADLSAMVFEGKEMEDGTSPAKLNISYTYSAPAPAAAKRAPWRLQ